MQLSVFLSSVEPGLIKHVLLVTEWDTNYTCISVFLLVDLGDGWCQ